MDPFSILYPDLQYILVKTYLDPHQARLLILVSKSWKEYIEPITTEQNNYVKWAAVNGHLDILKWLRANDCPWNSNTCTAAARNGHLDVLKWARANDCPWDSSVCNFTANGHFF